MSSDPRMTSTRQRDTDSLLCGWDGTEGGKKKKPKVRGVIPACVSAVRLSPTTCPPCVPHQRDVELHDAEQTGMRS